MSDVTRTRPAVLPRRDDPDGADVVVRDADDPEGLSSRVARGLKWSLVSSVMGRVITPITSIVLARVLVPADFGVFSVAVVMQAALMSFNDLGVTNALVWWRGDVRHAARTATTLAMATSGLLYAFCFLAAPAVSDLMGSPEATWVLRLLCLTVVIDSISSVPIGLLNRSFRQDRRAFADWIGFALSTVLTIALALAGFGAWSLAWGRVAGNAATTTSLYIFARERPRPGWDREVARTLVRYGLPLCGASLLVFAFLNLDYIIVGNVLGVTSLGLYTIAFNLSSWPSNVVSSTLRRVSIPAFSQLQDDRPAIDTAFLAGLHNVMMVTLPLCAGISALAVPLVNLVYPVDYHGASAALAVLALLGAARVFLDFGYDLLSGTGRTRPLFALQVLWIVVLMPALVIGAHIDGIAGVATAHVLVAIVLMVPAFIVVVRGHGPSARAVLAQVARPIGAAISAWIVGTLVIHQTSADLVAILAGGAALVLTYLLLVAPFAELSTLPRRLLRFEPAP